MPNFALDSDYVAIRDMARSFADKKLAPRALEWDEKKYFPVDVIREAAALGMAAIYVREDVGGSDAVRRGADLRGALEKLSRHRRLPTSWRSQGSARMSAVLQNTYATCSAPSGRRRRARRASR